MFAILIFLSTSSITVKAVSPKILNATYLNSNHFKAIAQAYRNNMPLLKNGKPIIGYAWNYDTAKDSTIAARAYCKQLTHGLPGTINNKIIFIGETSVPHDIDLNPSIIKYEQKVIIDLKAELDQTGKRELITRLSTILQKTGSFELSEKLLFDLAMGGEHLAQNALAYHWAELCKNLPIALSLSDAAISKDPGFFSYHDTRALVLLRLDHKKEALKASLHAVKLQAHPIALDHSGDILWRTNKKAEAVEQWRKAIIASKDILFIQRLGFKIKNGMTQDIIFE